MSLDQGNGRRKARPLKETLKVNLKLLVNYLEARGSFLKARVESVLRFWWQSL